jgi:hypothetical protein
MNRTYHLPLQAALWAALAGLNSTGAWARCGGELPIRARQQIEGNGLQLAFAPRPTPIPVNKPFSLDIVLCSLPGQPLPGSLQVDAENPTTHQALGRRITVRPTGGGRFTAEGLVLPKAGAWRLTFKLPAAVGMNAQQLSQDIVVI